MPHSNFDTCPCRVVQFGRAESGIPNHPVVSCRHSIVVTKTRANAGSGKGRLARLSVPIGAHASEKGASSTNRGFLGSMSICPRPQIPSFSLSSHSLRVGYTGTLVFLHAIPISIGAKALVAVASDRQTGSQVGRRTSPVYEANLQLPFVVPRNAAVCLPQISKYCKRTAHDELQRSAC